MKYDSVLDQQSISGKIVSLILCVWKPCYMKSGHILTLDNTNINTKSEHKVALYHRANLENIERDLLEFQTYFLGNDPYHKTVEQNWTDLKGVINDSVAKHMPYKTRRSNSKLPWINREI